MLFIGKSASPSPVSAGSQLVYTLQVVNAGQQATRLVVTDVVPLNTSYVPGSATAGGQLVGNQVRWDIPVLESGESRTFAFGVKVNGGREVANERYAVTSAEGVTGLGAPLITPVRGAKIYLPVVRKNAP